MSGPGDVGGEVSGDEAAWRDLVARLESPASKVTDTDTHPWPAREDLPGDAELPGDADRADDAELPGDADRAGSGDAADGAELAGGEDAAGSEDVPGDADPGTGQSAQAGTPTADGHPAADRRVSVNRQVPLDGTRIIRYAGDPRSYSPAGEDDERFKPEPLPPPARMDPVSKGAWVALIAGPGYLLLGTLLRWTISGTEALVAIAAFIAGFVILVVKMGDRPPRDDHDDGAVL